MKGAGPPVARSGAGRSDADGPDPEVRLIAAVAIRDGTRVLVIREEAEPHRHAWVLPQGYPKVGETLEQAASREAYEEVGLDVQIERTLGVYERFERGPTGGVVRWVTVCFLGHRVREEAPVASREAIDSAWIEPGRVDPATMPALRPMLADLAWALRP